MPLLAVSWPAPSPHLGLSPLLWLPDPGKPRGAVQVRCLLVAPGTQNKGSPLPTQRGGGKGQQGCGLSGQKEVSVLWPGHPRPQDLPAAATPGWGRVNTAAGRPGYLYRGPGAGPVPTAAPALPCPPQPAPSQRGTSQRGNTSQMQLPLSTEATGRIAQDASGFTVDA